MSCRLHTFFIYTIKWFSKCVLKHNKSDCITITECKVFDAFEAISKVKLSTWHQTFHEQLKKEGRTLMKECSEPRAELVGGWGRHVITTTSCNWYGKELLSTINSSPFY